MWVLRHVDTGDDVNIAGDVFVVGRNHRANLICHNIVVSKNHAKLYPSGDTLSIIDENSCNGTYINGKRIKHDMKTVINNNDEIGFGMFRNGIIVPKNFLPPIIIYKAIKIPSVSNPTKIQGSNGEVLIKEEPNDFEPTSTTLCNEQYPLNKVTVKSENRINDDTNCACDTNNRNGLNNTGTNTKLDVSTENIPIKMKLKYQDGNRAGCSKESENFDFKKPNNNAKIASRKGDTTTYSTEDHVILIDDDDSADNLNFMCSQLFVMQEPEAETNEDPSPSPTSDPEDNDIIIIDSDDDDDNYFNLMCSQILVKEEPVEPTTGNISIPKVTDYDFMKIKTEIADMDRMEDTNVTTIVLSDSINFDSDEDNSIKQLENILGASPIKPKDTNNFDTLNNVHNMKETVTVNQNEPVASTSKQTKPEKRKQMHLSIKQLPIEEAVLPKKPKLTEPKTRSKKGKTKPKETNHCAKPPVTRARVQKAVETISKPKRGKQKESAPNEFATYKESKEHIRDERRKKLKEIAIKSINEKATLGDVEKKNAPKIVLAAPSRGNFLLPDNNNQNPSGAKREQPTSHQPIYPISNYKALEQKHKDITNNLMNQHGDLIFGIISWNQNWITEQKKQDKLPPVASREVIKMCNSFGSFKDYYDVLQPLIVTEFWFSFCSQFEATKLPSNISSSDTIIARILCCNSTRTHTELTGSTYICKLDNDNNNHMQMNNFVFLTAHFVGQTNICKTFFGVVAWTHKNQLQGDDYIDARMAAACRSVPTTRLKFMLIVKNFPEKLNLNNQIIIRYFTQLPQYLKIFNSLKMFKNSPLLDSILEPKPDQFYVPIIKGINLYAEADLNESQKKAIHGICNLVASKKPGIFLIEGPPGTGKSTMIISALLELLLNRNSRECILLLAPSNAAIDSLIIKLLYNVKPTLKEHERHKIKLVRVGNHNCINPLVKKYTVDYLAKTNVSTSFLKEHPSARRDYEILVESISLLQSQVNAAPLDKALANKLKKKVHEREYFAQGYLKLQYRERLEKQKLLILQGANIICSTLISSTKAVVPKLTTHHIKTCIIDEASQSLESETLVPLALGVSKLVLVGDPQQLPAVASNILGKQYNYNRSLFARIKHNLERFTRNPIQMLNMQYRMHPEISLYPNKTFYGGKICDNFVARNQNLKALRPYIVFSTPSVNNNQYENIREVQILIFLVNAIRSFVDENCTFSIGIITPYSKQRAKINDELKNLRLNANTFITCNTVDGFQGQEKDIILISCVRNSPNLFLSDEQRLNVALTRAKYALYIVGTQTLLENCPTLKKLKRNAEERLVYYRLNSNINTSIFKKLIRKN